MPLISSKIASSKVNGPGDRCVIWFNSCSLGCTGCWNPETHRPNVNKHLDEDEIIGWILEHTSNGQGITFSGGEPMQQANSLARITKALKLMRPEISIGMYTGFTLRELESNLYNQLYYENGDKVISYLNTPIWSITWPSIRERLDFAIMGRFNQGQVDTTRPYLSSKNQELVLFTDRYKESDFKPQSIEFQLKDGLVEITGFPVQISDIIIDTISERNW